MELPTFTSNRKADEPTVSATTNRRARPTSDNRHDSPTATLTSVVASHPSSVVDPYAAMRHARVAMFV